MAKGNFETHDFYCLNCGRKALPLMRQKSHKHSSCHRKALFCPWCNVIVNHIEIATEDEKEWFTHEFIKGNFIEEALQSMQFCETEKKVYNEYGL